MNGKEVQTYNWMPDRGLRKGCPTSPTLFNIHHQAVMRKAKVERQATASTNNKEWEKHGATLRGTSSKELEGGRGRIVRASLTSSPYPSSQERPRYWLEGMICRK